MSQRNSGYVRRPDEDYPTPRWVTAIIAGHLDASEQFYSIWEPAAGDGALAEGLRKCGLQVLETVGDFFAYIAPPESVDCICTNPPYGADRRGLQACEFIRHALTLVPIVAMLLRVDFDSAKTRVDLFRDNPRFSRKIVLLDRIKWFEGEAGPSDNHAWFIWNAIRRRKAPEILYAERVRP